MCLLLVFMAALVTSQGARVEEMTVDSDKASTQSATEVLQKGEVVLDRFQLIAQSQYWPSDFRDFEKKAYLGRGAFGETWLAYDQKRNLQVAVKFFCRKGEGSRCSTLLNKQIAKPEEQAELAEVGTECSTPNDIIQAKPYPEGQSRFTECYANQVNHRKYAHIVLAVGGTQTLEEYVESQRKQISSTTIIRLAKMMLEGLVQMEGFFVHKDIKPANLMVFEDDDSKLYLRYIDLGLVAQEGKRSGVAGTPMFMPPEVWPDVPLNPLIDHKFDLYSVGETLYWLICGKTFHEYIFEQYGHLPVRQIAQQLKSQSPEAFCKPRDTLKEIFNLVVVGLMQGNPANRVDASDLIRREIFKNVKTMKAAPKAEGKKAEVQQVEPVMKPVEVRAPQPTFLDECHEDKRFWFKHADQCCLREKFDPLREEICRRPCGPKVPYRSGKCENDCDWKGDKTNTFSKALQCCVAVVFPSKCIYSDRLPAGEGWGWQSR